MSAGIKNDLEAGVLKEFVRQTAAARKSPGPSAALRESIASTLSLFAQSSLLSSVVPVDRLNRAAAGLFGEKRRVLCTCPVCRTDVLALALSSLPPCFCRSEHYGIAGAKVTGAALAQRIETAIRKVTLRPRHPAKGVRVEEGQVELVNFGLVAAKAMVGPLLAKIPGSCRCELCQIDTLACGLNQTPSRYGLAVGGKLRVPATHLDFLRHELTQTFAAAARRIAANPRHRGEAIL